MINNRTSANGRAAVADVGRPRDNGAPFTLTVVHHLPGRLRLRSAALSDMKAIERCRLRLVDIPGIISAKANPTTGSLLLKYDPAVIPPDMIAETLGRRGIMSLAVVPGPQPGGWDAIISMLRRLTLEVLAERLVLAVVG